MKVSYHNERMKGDPKHNDRDFDYEKAEHIDSKRTPLNKTLCVYPGKSFEQAEKEFYQKNFADYIKEVNSKISDPEKNKRKKLTSEKLRKGRVTKPEETIIQIGSKDDQPEDTRVLEKIFDEICRYNNKITHKHGKILSAALHVDETTPHIHMRKVWVYEENGVKKIGQERALERAGIPLPYPDKPEGRYNNRKITYDNMMREKIYELCKEYGLEIDVVPNKDNTKHLSKNEYISWQIEQTRRAEQMEREEEERKRKEKEKEKGLREKE